MQFVKKKHLSQKLYKYCFIIAHAHPVDLPSVNSLGKPIIVSKFE